MKRRESVLLLRFLLLTFFCSHSLCTLGVDYRVKTTGEATWDDQDTSLQFHGIAIASIHKSIYPQKSKYITQNAEIKQKNRWLY